jgi:hypothetical protein
VVLRHQARQGVENAGVWAVGVIGDESEPLVLNQEVPKMLNYRIGMGGHAPGHVRDTFLSAIDAYNDWDLTGPEPTLEFDVHYEPRPISLRRRAGWFGTAPIFCRAARFSS